MVAIYAIAFADSHGCFMGVVKVDKKTGAAKVLHSSRRGIIFVPICSTSSRRWRRGGTSGNELAYAGRQGMEPREYETCPDYVMASIDILKGML